MALWFECRVKYDKMQQNGQVKKITESYLLNALSFAEAEARIVDKMTPYISGDFTVSAVKKTKIAEIFNKDMDRFWLARVEFIQIDEKTGNEKASITEMLVGASDFDEALLVFKEGMNGTVSDYELVSLSESAILEVFDYEIGKMEQQ